MSHIKLTIELDGVSFDIDADFDYDDEGAFIENAHPCDTNDEEIMRVWNESTDQESATAIWAAYDDYVAAWNEL